MLLPLAFCRECGQEYYVVTQAGNGKAGGHVYAPRDLRERRGAHGETAGYLFASESNPWPHDLDRDALVQRLPEDWVETSSGEPQIKKSNRDRLPKEVFVGVDGAEQESGSRYHFIPAPFAFCANCGVAYAGRQPSDYGKLASLSSEGRSTATTLLSVAVVQALRATPTLEEKARKLLSFSDNRQDASLQAGHLNDYIEVGLLRSAVYQAATAAGNHGITHEVLGQRVFDALKLPFGLFAVDAEVKFQARTETDRALREVLLYRLYRDLRRGWRVTAPNLEQCGLLHIDYLSLDELCSAEEEWRNAHPALADASPEVRMRVARNLLDYLRRGLAIKVEALNESHQESTRHLSNLRLREPWAIDERENLVHAYVAFPRASRPNETKEYMFVSGRGGFGTYLRRTGTLPHYPHKQKPVESEQIIRELFEILRVAGLVEPVLEPSDKDDVPGYQVPASCFVWRAGDGSDPSRDVIRVLHPPAMQPRTNPYFTDFYRQPPERLQHIRAREHTCLLYTSDAADERF